MKNADNSYRDLKVVVMGLGVNQGGLGVSKWLLKHGARWLSCALLQHRSQPRQEPGRDDLIIRATRQESEKSVARRLLCHSGCNEFYYSRVQFASCLWTSLSERVPR